MNNLTESKKDVSACNLYEFHSILRFLNYFNFEGNSLKKAPNWRRGKDLMKYDQTPSSPANINKL